MTDKPLPESIKWRNSIYNFEKLENNKVYWYNPVSRHRDSCSIEAWINSEPYEGQLA